MEAQHDKMESHEMEAHEMEAHEIEIGEMKTYKMKTVPADNGTNFIRNNTYYTMDKATPTKKRGHCQAEVLLVPDIIFVMAPVLSKPRPAPTNGGHNNSTNVAQLHAENYPHSERDVDSIQRKYQKLYRKLTSGRIPTGDPNIPDKIAFLAKEIKYLIGQTVNDDTSCNDNNYTPIWERNNGNDTIPPVGQPSQLTSSSSVKSPILVDESVIPEAPLSLSSTKLKKTKKKRFYKKKVASDDEIMNSILSLARAYFSCHNNNNNNNNNSSSSSSDNNSNAKCTHDESNNTMVERCDY
eukprot:jgi/Psemu1/33173/gm1.33173_g